MVTPDSLVALDRQHVDVAIIGAGINGASAAQHLSAAGYRVLVVDQGDFANGATSRSSRLLHCGLRHLATGSSVWKTLLRPDRLAKSMVTVRADMLARDDIVRTIPDRVKPINFCLPIYSDDQYAPWHMDMAFAALRMTSPRGVPLDYHRYRPGDLGRVPIAPWLRDTDKLRAVAVFREYLFDWPERIALDAVFDARRMGAIVRNYTRVEALERLETKGCWQMVLRPTGQGPEMKGESATITADMVLNLAGAWVDEVIHTSGSNLAPKCNGMKGIHIALKLPDVFAEWGVFTYNSLGEPLYCLPFRGIHYIGLTRTPFQGDIAGVSATDQEIDWIISETNRCLPKLAVSRDDILFTWAGVNPLTHDPAEPLGSREIKIHDLADDGMPGMLALTGGPIMTHRRVANSLVKAVAARLPPSGSPQPLQCSPDEMATGPDARFLEQNGVRVSVESIEKAARDELPGNLSDLIMRRLGLGWNPDQGLGLAAEIAYIAAPHFGWSKEQIRAELKAYQHHLRMARRKPNS